MSLQIFGVDAFRAAIARGIEIAEQVERRVERSQVLELVTPAMLGIVNFRVKGRGTEALMAICNELRESGFAMLSTTRLKGETVLRMCTINPRTTDADIEATLARIEELAAR
jgi:glutamate/tyrosine decarboxylase-like PLP-dependent enzyme